MGTGVQECRDVIVVKIVPVYLGAIDEVLFGYFLNALNALNALINALNALINTLNALINTLSTDGSRLKYFLGTF